MTVATPIMVLLVLVFLAAGTAGYVLIEDWEWIDGLYMTLITLTTVGFALLVALTLVVEQLRDPSDEARQSAAILLTASAMSWAPA